MTDPVQAVRDAGAAAADALDTLEVAIDTARAAGYVVEMSRDLRNIPISETGAVQHDEAADLAPKASPAAPENKALAGAGDVKAGE